MFVNRVSFESGEKYQWRRYRPCRGVLRNVFVRCFWIAVWFSWLWEVDSSLPVRPFPALSLRLYAHLSCTGFDEACHACPIFGAAGLRVWILRGSILCRGGGPSFRQITSCGKSTAGEVQISLLHFLSCHACGTIRTFIATRLMLSSESFLPFAELGTIKCLEVGLFFLLPPLSR